LWFAASLATAGCSNRHADPAGSAATPGTPAPKAAVAPHSDEATDDGLAADPRAVEREIDTLEKQIDDSPSDARATPSNSEPGKSAARGAVRPRASRTPGSS
jgi:hypothetical protein